MELEKLLLATRLYLVITQWAGCIGTAELEEGELALTNGVYVCVTEEEATESVDEIGDTGALKASIRLKILRLWLSHGKCG